jgi:hypothetical protein
LLVVNTNFGALAVIASDFCSALTISGNNAAFPRRFNFDSWPLFDSDTILRLLGPERFDSDEKFYGKP